ncbi:MAG: hypothetical protein V7633_1148 [Pseudonocardia sp.]|jgi:hypothetical protein
MVVADEGEGGTVRQRAPHDAVPVTRIGAPSAAAVRAVPVDRAVAAGHEREDATQRPAARRHAGGFTGTPTENGAVLKAETSRTLPATR